MSHRSIPRPTPAAGPGPFELMEITGSRISPRLLGALAARQPAPARLRRVLHPVASTED